MLVAHDRTHINGYTPIEYIMFHAFQQSAISRGNAAPARTRHNPLNREAFHIHTEGWGKPLYGLVLTEPARIQSWFWLEGLRCTVQQGQARP